MNAIFKITLLSVAFVAVLFNTLGNARDHTDDGIERRQIARASQLCEVNRDYCASAFYWR